MEKSNVMYVLINLVLGVIFAVIGFKTYKTLGNNKETAGYKKFRLFFRVTGVGFMIWGLINLL